MTRKSRAAGPARDPGAASPKRTAQRKAKAGAAAEASAPLSSGAAETGELLCDLCWERGAPAAGQILLCREAGGRFSASVALPGMRAFEARAADLQTLIGWLEALEPPGCPPGAVVEGAAECLAEDRLEDLLVLAARRALQDKFDQLRGEALALWSDIEGKDCR